jgi:hypothetical protein
MSVGAGRDRPSIVAGAAYRHLRRLPRHRFLYQITLLRR